MIITTKRVMWLKNVIFFDSASATRAGFNVLRLVNECSAAALAYDLGQLDNTEKL